MQVVNVWKSIFLFDLLYSIELFGEKIQKWKISNNF